MSDTVLAVLQLVIIAMYVAMFGVGVWIVRLVKEFIALLRKVEVTLAVTAVNRQTVIPDAPGTLAVRTRFPLPGSASPVESKSVE